MDHTKVLHYCDLLLKKRGEEADVKNFLEYSEKVAAIARDLTGAERGRLRWFKEWVPAFRALYDDFDAIVKADPMMMYQPAHDISKAFHSSPAFVRYYRAGNRTSKTQSGYSEHYFITTGQHRYRKYIDPPTSSFIIGLAFTKYAPEIFQKKFFEGEPGNIISPIFPIGGKWFNHYDERKHILKIACPNCAEAGKAGSCKHQKSTITLFSDDGGVDVLQGGQHVLGHFDEHIGEEFFREAVQRTMTIPGAGIIVTGTPLHGLEAWEQRILAKRAKGAPEGNRTDPDDPDSPPYVELFEIDQFSAGIVPHHKIKAEMAGMDQFEIESRVYGRPAPLAKNPVFDRKKLADMREKQVRDPKRGVLECPVPLMVCNDKTPMSFYAQNDGDYRVWEKPETGAQYIIGVDSAAGLTKGDPCCATVLKIGHEGMALRLDMVAQFHGWLPHFSYAEEIFKFAVWYNSAMVVVELTGGHGMAVVHKMKELAYWNIYRQYGRPESAESYQDVRFGVSTDASTKPFMVSSLQQLIRDNRITFPCADTIGELVAFEQESSQTGLTVRYRGAGGTHDDRVMSLCIATSVAMTYPVYEFGRDIPVVENSMEYSGEWAKIHRELRDGEEPEPFDWN